jgi:hypothetical protein
VGGNLTFAGGRNRGASAGGSILFQTSPAAGAGTTGTLATALTIDSTKLATFAGTILVTGSGNALEIPAGATIYWTGRGTISAPADGQANFRNGASTAGIGLDFATDSALTINNRAHTAAASVGLGPSGSATSTRQLVKKVTGIADNTATDVLTVTVPNANHAATIKITLLSSNGSTDAFESSRTADGSIVLARTTGVATVAVVATLALAQIATVGGGATHTLAYGVSAMTGAVGDPQTFTVQVTIDDSGNLGSNQVVILVELINAEATGITIA